MPLVSLIVPTYNERESIVTLLEQVLEVMSSFDLEILVVDDDSPDATWKAVEDFAKEHPPVRLIRRRSERGLSSAVLEGFARARGELLAVMDADLSHDPERLPSLIEAALEGADLAVGSRRIRGGGADHWPWYRRLTSEVATRLAQLWCRPPLADPMSGYFVMKRSVLGRLTSQPRPRGYKVLLEILCRAEPLTVVELPYIFKDRKQGHSKLSPRVAYEYLCSLWKLPRLPRAR